MAAIYVYYIQKGYYVELYALVFHISAVTKES